MWAKCKVTRQRRQNYTYITCGQNNIILANQFWTALSLNDMPRSTWIIQSILHLAPTFSSQPTFWITWINQKKKTPTSKHQPSPIASGQSEFISTRQPMNESLTKCHKDIKPEQWKRVVEGVWWVVPCVVGPLFCFATLFEHMMPKSSRPLQTHIWWHGNPWESSHENPWEHCNVATSGILLIYEYCICMYLQAWINFSSMMEINHLRQLLRLLVGN